MTNKEFDEMLSRRLGKIKEVLASKSKEYGQEDDRLRDFNLIAKIADVDVGIVWRVLHAKHLASVYNMLEHKLPITVSMIDEKVGDKINYGPLVEAILIEEAGIKTITDAEYVKPSMSIGHA